MPKIVVFRLRPVIPVSATDFNNFYLPIAADVIVTELSSGAIVPVTSIAQHTASSVATAVCVLPAPLDMLTTIDIQVQINGNSGLKLDVAVYNMQPQTVLAVPAADASLTPSTFIALPHNSVMVTNKIALPANGKPPKFTELKLAVDAATSLPLDGLTLANCQTIAQDILSAPIQNPLPAPPSTTSLEAIYTSPDSGTDASDRSTYESMLALTIGNAFTQGVTKLAEFIYSLTAAYYAETQSTTATQARIVFPVRPNALVNPAPLTEMEVMLVGVGMGTLVPPFTVPALYYYAYGASMPSTITREQRYQMIGMASETQLIAQFQDAEAVKHIIDSSGAIEYIQAARRIKALNLGTGNLTAVEVNTTDLQNLVQAWLNSTLTNMHVFWMGADPQIHFELVLAVLTDSYDDLIADIKALPADDVEDITTLTEQEWRDIFIGVGYTTGIDYIPIGSPIMQVNAFVAFVSNYFMPQPGGATGTQQGSLGNVSNNPLQAMWNCYSDKNQGFQLGQEINEEQLLLCVPENMTGDPCAQEQLIEMFLTLNNLYGLAASVPGMAGVPLFTGGILMTVLEVLYSCGITSQADVCAMTAEQFEQAVAGTILMTPTPSADPNISTTWGLLFYEHNIKACTISPAGPRTEAFVPVNFNGELVNCIPPEHLSPSGIVGYLHELLLLSKNATCDTPFVEIDGSPNLLSSILNDGRRGPLADLNASYSNTNVTFPDIDKANECLESLVMGGQGVIFNNSETSVGGHLLLQNGAKNQPDDDPDTYHHDPARLLGAVPEFAAPAAPVAQQAAYDKLKNDFSSFQLPYDQARDLTDTYLCRLGSNSFDTQRRFRKNIRAFALKPDTVPTGFMAHMWRMPFERKLAMEYIGFSEEEYLMLFADNLTTTEIHTMYGFVDPEIDGRPWTSLVTNAGEFLDRTGLNYCQLLDLQESGFVKFEIRGGQGVKVPDCEPCQAQDFQLEFASTSAESDLMQLAIFLRIWKKMQLQCSTPYSFETLRDICMVFELFIGGNINPDFPSKLAHFEWLCNTFHLPLRDSKDGSTIGVGTNNTHILALWDSGATKYSWAEQVFLEGIQRTADAKRHCGCRPQADFILFKEHIPLLAMLAGFNTAPATDTWNYCPLRTAAFAEFLQKLWLSEFAFSEILALFTTEDQLAGDSFFQMQSANEARCNPLNWAEDSEEFSLLALREKLLAINVTAEQASELSWSEIVEKLYRDWGYAPNPSTFYDPLLEVGKHFFPNVLIAEGIAIGNQDHQYRTGLAGSPPSMWNTAVGGQFFYDTIPVVDELGTQLPIQPDKIVEKLSRIRTLNAAERQAVLDLTYAAHRDLAGIGFIFPNFGDAVKDLIEEADEMTRWASFQQYFAKYEACCKAIAEHLTAHVASVTGQENSGGYAEAWLLLKMMAAVENKSTSAFGWEDDSGQMPNLAWSHLPNGGAFASLNGVTGNGWRMEYNIEGAATTNPVWRSIVNSSTLIGGEGSVFDSPPWGILPETTPAVLPDYSQYVKLRNGYYISNHDGSVLGCAQGFSIHCYGMFLITKPGKYVFKAGLPTPGNEDPDFKGAAHQKWRVVASCGQKRTVLLSHHWESENSPGDCSIPVKMQSGMYEITIEFIRPQPVFDSPDDVCPIVTGFQLKYSGPETDDVLRVLPFEQMYLPFKDDTLAEGIAATTTGVPKVFLENLVTSTVRCERLTYWQVFRGLLFSTRLGLSAQIVADNDIQSELGYLLSNSSLFAGTTYYRSGSNFIGHETDLSFNFLPFKDNFFPLSATQDGRTVPTRQRMAAMADWFIRLFDYTQLRYEARLAASEPPVVNCFIEAQEDHLSGINDPANLIRHLGISMDHADQVLNYLALNDIDPNLSTPYTVTNEDLFNEIWAIRLSRAEQWLDRIACKISVKDIRILRPDLVASENPAFLYPGQTVTGNQNLSYFVRSCLIENAEPRLYKDLEELNNGLRLRANQALIEYLTHLNRVEFPWAVGTFATSPKDLSAILLLDVDPGICQKSSRIENAISAVQRYVMRATLGLEPALPMSAQFSQAWDKKFASYQAWKRCKFSELYPENWIRWQKLEETQHSGVYQFFEQKLRQNKLTVARPGGLVYWPASDLPPHDGVSILQNKEASQLQLLSPAQQGFDLLGQPDAAGAGSWLASLHSGTVPNTAGTAEWSFWQEAARIGVPFVAIPGAGIPPASSSWDCSSDTACCTDCGAPEHACIPTYYFWLVDKRGYEAIFQHVDWAWQDPAEVPTLLNWGSKPMVRLAWASVVDGKMGQMRWSSEGVRVSGTTGLKFLGRFDDLFQFEVVGGLAPVGYPPPPSVVGFLYNLAGDEAIVLPTIDNWAPSSAAYFGGSLTSFPYFLFFDECPRVEPPSIYAPAMAMADHLRSRCEQGAALAWYREFYNPHQRDNRWDVSLSESEIIDRSVLLAYLETLIEYADGLMRENTPESFQQASLLMDTAGKILGKCPRNIYHKEGENAVIQSVGSFAPMQAGTNPRLLSVFERINDRTSLIESCQNAMRLKNGKPNKEMPYFGNSEFFDGWEPMSDDCCESNSCYCAPVYRFPTMLALAKERANLLSSLGNALLSASEKLDAEMLSALREVQGNQMLRLALDNQKDNVRAANWRTQLAQKTLERTIGRYFHYVNEVVPYGDLQEEIDYFTYMNIANIALGVSVTLETIAQFIKPSTPDTYTGSLGVMTHNPGSGNKLGQYFEIAARISNLGASIASNVASQKITRAGLIRQEVERIQLIEDHVIMIEENKRQLRAAEAEERVALRNLNQHQQQIEHSNEVINFLRDKQSNQELYAYMKNELMSLYAEMYRITLDTAKKAKAAFDYEKGYNYRDFFKNIHWNNQFAGLTVGEQLLVSLHEMERDYMCKNNREYELSKPISLRLHMPEAFLKLKLTGNCHFDLTEKLFDSNHAGHYFRRINSVALTFPCVTGPYTTLNAELELTKSMVRVDPRLLCPEAGCCDSETTQNGYEARLGDQRIKLEYFASEAIATSTGMNDSGMAELNYRDERYLWFQYRGAISSWSLRLPQETNHFDIEATLQDVIMHLNYLARPGGEALQHAALETIRDYLPGNGKRLFSWKEDFSQQWFEFTSIPVEDGFNVLKLQLARQHFPFIPNRKVASVVRLEFYFKPNSCHDCDVITLEYKDKEDCGHGKKCKGIPIRCVRRVDWADYYHGVINLKSAICISDQVVEIGQFVWPKDMLTPENMYVICTYEAERSSCKNHGDCNCHCS